MKKIEKILIKIYYFYWRYRFSKNLYAEEKLNKITRKQSTLLKPI